MSTDFIRQRRSIRQYNNRPVEPDLIHSILEAGMSAPSAGNQRPWDFIVVTDHELIEKMSLTGPNSLPAKNAPVVILITGDTGRERYKDYWPVDCAAATENMLLEITRLGLGAVWLGVHPVVDRKEYLRNLFLLPSTVHPFAMISLGYAETDMKKERESRYDESRVHYNHW
ncbi:MAG: nitroreductase family protein [Bacteroidetes bacterium HGW-Bacteroidetes-22]|nr:MAG: nitroreductase family protein [Bacteroidetes bacterium HGW-Bacteroidetes-22]